VGVWAYRRIGDRAAFRPRTRRRPRPRLSALKQG